jgi:hypothetical protein
LEKLRLIRRRSNPRTDNSVTLVQKSGVDRAETCEIPAFGAGERRAWGIVPIAKRVQRFQNLWWCPALAEL